MGGDVSVRNLSKLFVVGSANYRRLSRPLRRWLRLRQQPLPGRAGCLVSATEIVRTKYNARAWQWFSTFSLKAFVNRVNHLMLVPNGEGLCLGE